MYCSTCGSWSAQGARFCWKCGRTLGAPSAPQPPAASPEPPPPAAAEQHQAAAAAPQGSQPPSWPQVPVLSPAFGPAPVGWFYLSASGLATAITVLAAITAALFGIGAAVALAGAVQDDWATLDVFAGFLAFGYLAAAILGIVLIVWTRRITGNLLPFQPALELGTGWAVGAWFVPIISYWFPLRIWNQAWRATTPTIQPPIGWQWKGLPVPPTHILSWVLWHVGIVIAPIGVPTEDDTSTAIGYAGFIGGAMVAAALALLIVVVRNLTRRQDEYARRYLPQGAFPTPYPPAPGPGGW